MSNKLSFTTEEVRKLPVRALKEQLTRLSIGFSGVVERLDLEALLISGSPNIPGGGGAAAAGSSLDEEMGTTETVGVPSWSTQGHPAVMRYVQVQDLHDLWKTLSSTGVDQISEDDLLAKLRLRAQPQGYYVEPNEWEDDTAFRDAQTPQIAPPAGLPGGSTGSLRSTRNTAFLGTPVSPQTGAKDSVVHSGEDGETPAASLHNEGHAKYAEEASKMWAEAKTDAYLELDIKGVKSELTRLGIPIPLNPAEIGSTLLEAWVQGTAHPHLVAEREAWISETASRLRDGHFADTARHTKH